MDASLYIFDRFILSFLKSRLFVFNSKRKYCILEILVLFPTRCANFLFPVDNFIWVASMNSEPKPRLFFRIIISFHDVCWFIIRTIVRHWNIKSTNRFNINVFIASNHRDLNILELFSNVFRQVKFLDVGVSMKLNFIILICFIFPVQFILVNKLYLEF